MSRRLYASDAERQRAYRERQRAMQAISGTVPPATVRAPPEPSRPARLRTLREDAQKLAAEYQNWRDRLPANLAEGQIADQLDEVMAQFDEVAAILEAIDPPTVGGPRRAPRTS